MDRESALIKFEELSKDTFDIQLVFDRLLIEGYNPDLICYDNYYVIEVEIDKIIIKAWSEQSDNMKGWHIQTHRK